MHTQQLPDLLAGTQRIHLVVGPPGCGKTTYLAAQAQRAADKFGAHAVAICSLTKAAAIEVAGRDTTIPSENISTLHAHAFRALQRPALAESPDGIADWNKVCGSNSWKISGGNGDLDGNAAELLMFGADGDRLLLLCHALRAALVPATKWVAEVQRFHERWERFKTETGRLDFTDLIERAADTDRMPCSPRIVMIDEAQDLSALEMNLIRAWTTEDAGVEQVVIVGDPDQALYTWRGASPTAVFGDNVEALRVLQQSYRVPAAVHEAAVRMIERIPERLPVAYHPRLDDAGQVVAGELAYSDVMFHDPGPLRTLLEQELGEGRTVMVLCACGYMLKPLMHELRVHGLPFHNPYRVKHGGWNPMRGTRRLLAFLRPSREAWGNQARMWTWDDLHAWMAPMKAAGVITRGFKTFVEAKCQPDRFGETLGSETPTIAAVLEMFKPEHHEALLDMDVQWWLKNLKHADQARMDYGVQVLQRQGPAALHAEPSLIIGTIHSVKGGEADTVVLFPDLSTAGYYQGLKTVGEAHDSVIRQFYVGMTRARTKLILAAPSTPAGSSSEAIEWAA